MFAINNIIHRDMESYLLFSFKNSIKNVFHHSKNVTIKKKYIIHIILQMEMVFCDNKRRNIIKRLY